MIFLDVDDHQKWVSDIFFCLNHHHLTPQTYINHLRHIPEGVDFGPKGSVRFKAKIYTLWNMAEMIDTCLESRMMMI